MPESVAVNDVRSVTLSSMRRYLFAKGWRAREPRRANEQLPEKSFELFQHGSIRAPQIILPTSSGAIDLHFRIRDAIQVLSENAELDWQTTVNSVVRIGYDVVRSAIPSEQVVDDAIKLSAAAEFIAHMRGLLAATATTEKNPRPYYSRLLKDSVAFANACRFGHTYRGSFGFTIESPLPTLEAAPLLAEAPTMPFERRVLQRLARGISNVVNAGLAKDTKPLIEMVPTGFGANGCELLADLIDEVSPAGLIVSFDLSPEWQADESVDGSVYAVNALHGEICRSAAKEMRRNDTVTPVALAGRIIRLQNQTDPTDFDSQTGEHEIVVLWSSAEFGDIQVRMNLAPADYLSAVAAHGQGLPIWVGGELVRVGRQWYLRKPKDFSVPRQGTLPFEVIEPS